MSTERVDPGPYAVRPARDDDVPLLPAIDLAAAARFRTSPFPFVADGATEIEVFQSGQARQQLWLAVDAGDRPVGFALACVVDDALYLDELAVDPAHGRCGLGTQLLETVVPRGETDRLPRGHAVDVSRDCVERAVLPATRLSYPYRSRGRPRAPGGSR